jgi:phosphoribosylamine--glycine ligase
LEIDRQYGQKIFSVIGINTLPTINFKSFNETINFLKKNPGPWVIKQNGHTEKSFNYVGRMKDNRDAISLLETYNHLYHPAKVNIDIQERVYGPEVAIARYFNGKDWVGPICISIEHKDFFTGNLGPKTYEMGTLMWYTDDENNKLFQETLAKIKDFLIKINYRGQFDINSILTKDKVYPLEATARFGYPQFELQTEFHASPGHKFLKALADGKKFDLKWNRGYGIVNLIACPPFPYRMGSRKFFVENTEIIFKEKFSSEGWKHIHFNEVKLEGKKYLISENGGYVMHVSERANSIEKARQKI